MGLTWIIKKIYLVYILKLINLFQRAEVAELVDALGSGSSGHTPVRVRVSPSAPQLKQLVTHFGSLFEGHFFVLGKHFAKTPQSGQQRSTNLIYPLCHILNPYHPGYCEQK